MQTCLDHTVRSSMYACYYSTGLMNLYLCQPLTEVNLWLKCITSHVIPIILQSSELTIGFEQSTYTTSEGNGTVTVCAEILEGSVQRSLTGVSFTFEAQGGTAAGEW